MGCGSSTDTKVHPLTPEEVKGDEDETSSKLGGRGDSAVSKGTTDSGVVMENREIPALPGAVPLKLPPLTPETVRDSEVDKITQDRLLQQDGTAQERPRSSKILEELLSEGIIPTGQSREKGSGAGEAYSIMLDDSEGVKRRPPARLKSLKTKKAQHLNREEIEEKMRLVEERRKIREDELKMRLRTQSARVRGPAPIISSTEQDEDASLTSVEPLQSPLIGDPTPAPPLHSQTARQAADGGEQVREGEGEETVRAEEGEGREEGGESRDDRGEGEGRRREDSENEEEELTQVEELRAGQLLTASGELESDSRFQHAEEKEEIF